MNNRSKIFYKKLGENLRRARKNKGYTQTQVAELIGKSTTSVSENERGVTEIPFSTIMEYCQIYGVDINDLTPKF